MATSIRSIYSNKKKRLSTFRVLKYTIKTPTCLKKIYFNFVQKNIKSLIFVKSKRIIINNKEFYLIWDRLATEIYELHHVETFLNTNEKSMPILVYFISTNSQSCIFQVA